MTRQTGEFEHQSVQDTKSIVKYLEALANGFRNGRLLFCTGKKELVLKPNNLLKFSVKAKSKDSSTKVTLSVAWKEGRRSRAESEPLVIDSSDGSDAE
jgi:amphi-Trp domain-containing protein